MKCTVKRRRKSGVKSPKQKLSRLVDEISKQFGIKILKFANVGNHLHLAIKLPGSTMTSRRQYAKWIRLLTSRLAFHIGGSKKGLPFRDENGMRAKFWDAIPFSRVIHGRRGWDIISRYVLKNELESQGVSATVAVAMAHEMFESARALDQPDWKNSA